MEKDFIFGEGFAYCIGLFLAHAERKETRGYCWWFNAAADHLFDLNIPENFILREASYSTDTTPYSAELDLG